MTTPTLLSPPVDIESLVATAHALFASDKGLLAIDESIPTCNKRFARLGITQNEPTRRAYRELIVTTPGLGECISGAILYDETIREHTRDGVPFLDVLAKAGILAGIKVNLGAKPMPGFPGEKLTQGLDGLRGRLSQYAQMGARFAKWRAVFTIGGATPSRPCVQANADALARYAAWCQQAGLVPIVEPEVLMAGDHSLARCDEVTQRVLEEVFAQLKTQDVVLEAMLLKPNMILAGSESRIGEEPDTVAAATLDCLRGAVPAAVAGIAFLSGGQSGDLATARLAAINNPALAPTPWPIGFSFGRAIQQPALRIWDGQEDNVTSAQHALLRRATANRDARRSKHTPSPSTGHGAEARPAKPGPQHHPFEEADTS